MAEQGNTGMLELLLDEIKNILSECNDKIREIRSQREADLVEEVSQEDWEKSVDRVKACDFIRGKKPFARRFMGAMEVDADAFYDKMKSFGPLLFTKIDKANIDSIFLDKSKTVNESNYQTFFNGYSVEAYGIGNSLGFIKDEEGAYYAYLPVMSNHVLCTQADYVVAMEKAKVHISSRYIPAEFELFSWYKLTENHQKKNKHSEEYYEEKVNEIKESYREQVEEKISSIARIYEQLENAYPLCENLDRLLDSDVKEIPELFSFGSCSLKTMNGEMRIPQLRRFPLTNAMWFEDNDLPTVHALYLRLLCSLPVGKVQFTVFDPNGSGKNVDDFNCLIDYPELFPAKKVIHDKEELKKELKETLDYVGHIRQKVFTNECCDWVQYNRLMGRDNVKKMLPYKVFTFFDVPDEMDTELLGILNRLIGHSRDCGFLVLFSYRKRPEKSSDSKWNVLEECIGNARSLSEELNGPDESIRSVKNSVGCSVEFFNEEISDKVVLNRLLKDYLIKLEKQNAVIKYEFAEMLNSSYLFDKDSRNGLEFTIGYDDKTEEEVKLRIDDRKTHYLIGGMTGSGKSNLLHNLIMSACARYSPKELQIYLLDFKEGVEFSTYARKKSELPHARLVAMEADVEYGTMVLEYLTQENKNRYQRFKKYECTNIAEYRHEKPEAIMPRILVIVDEFQKMLKGSDKEKVMEKLLDLAQQGRASGIHLVMAAQSLNGLDFGALETQFAGRIVLKCQAEDSKRLLGGISSNNEAAASLEVPYAIINTSQGSVSGNVKVAIPKADSDVIKETIIAMKDNPLGCAVDNIVIFRGKSLPKHPGTEEFVSEKAEVILGKELSFNAEKFTIKLQPKVGDNILCLMDDGMIKKNLIRSMMRSVVGSKFFDEFIYIGIDEEVLNAESNEKLKFFKHIPEFLEYIGEEMFCCRRLVVFDDCNLGREVAFPTGYGAVPTGDAKKILDYMLEASNHQSHCVAFYSRVTNMKDGKLPWKEVFDHRIGYELNDDITREFVGNMSLGKNHHITNRCFYAENGTIVGWFQPFVTEETVEEEQGE